MIEYNYKKDLELKINVLKELQIKNKFIISSKITEMSWEILQKTLIDFGINIEEIYMAYSNVFSLPVYNDEEIIYKSKNIALSEGVIFVSNPSIINTLDFIKKSSLTREYKIGFINQDILNKNMEKSGHKYSNINKVKKIISNNVLKSFSDGFSRIEVIKKDNEVLIYSLKNTRKIITRISVKIDSDIFESIMDMINPALDKKFTLSTIKSSNKLIIKSQKKDLNYGDEILSNNDTKDDITSVLEKNRGVIFIGGQKEMGKTFLLKGLSEIIERQDETKDITIISDKGNLNTNISADVIIVDIENPLDYIKTITELSIMGALVLVSITSLNSIHSLKMLKYKIIEDKNMIADELVGFYHQVIIPSAIDKEVQDVTAFDVKEYKNLLNYKNRPDPNQMVLEIKTISKEIPDIKIISEWLEASPIIKKSLCNDFSEKEIIVEKRSEEWEDMSEKALLLLKQKEITINDFLKKLILF